jgi:hypothetical protein
MVAVGNSGATCLEIADRSLPPFVVVAILLSTGLMPPVRAIAFSLVMIVGFFAKRLLRKEPAAPTPTLDP